MREVFIDEADFETAEALHAYLARELAFPDYYGHNLDALNDCLGDIDEPTLVVVVRKRFNEDEELLAQAPATEEALNASARALAPYLDKMCVSLMRAARTNSALDVGIMFPEYAADAASMDDAGEQHFATDE